MQCKSVKKSSLEFQKYRKKEQGKKKIPKVEHREMLMENELRQNGKKKVKLKNIVMSTLNSRDDLESEESNNLNNGSQRMCRDRRRFRDLMLERQRHEYRISCALKHCQAVSQQHSDWQKRRQRQSGLLIKQQVGEIHFRFVFEAFLHYKSHVRLRYMSLNCLQQHSIRLLSLILHYLLYRRFHLFISRIAALLAVQESSTQLHHYYHTNWPVYLFTHQMTQCIWEASFTHYEGVFQCLELLLKGVQFRHIKKVLQQDRN